MKRMKKLKRKIAMIMAMATLFTTGVAPVPPSFAMESETEATETMAEDATDTDATITDAKEDTKEVIYGGPLPVGFEWVYDAPEEYFEQDLHMTKQEYVDMLCGTNYAQPFDESNNTVDENGISISPRSYQLLTAGAINTKKFSDVKWWMEAKCLGVSYGESGCYTGDAPSSGYGWSCAGFVSSVVYRFYDKGIINADNTAVVSSINAYCTGSKELQNAGDYSVKNGDAYYKLCQEGKIKPGDVLIFTRDGDFKHAAIAGDDNPSGIDKIDGVYYIYHALNSRVGTVVTTAGYYLSGKNDKTGNHVYVYRPTPVDEVKGKVSLKKIVDNTAVYENYDYSYVGCEYTIYNSSRSPIGTFQIESDGRGKVISSYYGGVGTYTMTGLPAGNYTVAETKVTSGLIAGYTKINEAVTNTFTVSESNKEITIVGMNNIHFNGTLGLHKIASNGAFGFDMSGATYDVYHVNAALGMNDTKKEYVGSFITDRNGVGHVTYNVFNNRSNAAGIGDYDQTTMTKLPYGTYAVIETKAPSSGLFDVNTSAKITTITAGSLNQSVTDAENFHPYKVSLVKSSANTTVSTGNNCYSFAGTTYTVYTDVACTNIARAYKEDGTAYDAKLMCDANGKTATLLMEKGVYYVKETVAGKGYALDTSVHTIELTDAHRDTPYELKVSDKPQMDPVNILLRKQDADAPGDYYIEGATFEVKYYAGEYADGVDPETLGVSATRSWMFKSASNGRVVFGDNKDCFISGDEFYRNSAGIIMLPLGTVTIQEKSTPVEYILDDTVYVRKITVDGVIESVTTYNEPVIPNKPKRQAFQIKKLGETSSSELNPLANAGFMAANIKDLDKDADGNYIWDESKAIMLCDINHTPENFNDDVKELFTDADGYAISAKLRYGTYLVRETTVPKNYKAIKDFTITIDHDSDVPQETRYFVDEIIKSYLRIIKVDETTKLPILSTDENVKFKIYSYDDKKYLSFKSYINGKFENVSEFTINNDGYVMTPGVLVAGSYRLEEYSLLTDHYMKNPSGQYDFVIDKDTIFENYVDEEGNEADAPLFTVRVENTPYYGQLEVNKKGEFYELVDGAYEKQEVLMEGIEFGIYAAEDICTNDNQNTILYHKDELVYTITTDKNGYAASNCDLPLGAYYLKEQNCPDEYEPCEDVAFEISTDGDIRTVDNADGTVLKYISVKKDVTNYKKIEIGTSATDKNTGLQSAFAGKDATIVDDVVMKNLLLGHTYRLEGKLYDTKTGEPVVIAGKEVTAEKEFTATEGVMTVSLEYKLDAESIKGKKTVVFEELYEGEKKKASHCLIDEKSQQIDFAQIKTTFLDSESMDHDSSSANQVVLTDYVDYKGLVLGKSYTLTAVIMDKETEKPLLNGMLPVVSTVTFVPEKSEGTTEVCFEVDGNLIKGKTIVCFEALSYENKLLAIHADIHSKDQTIYGPQIMTEAKDAKYLGHVSMLDREITIIDTVKYNNLDTSKSYTVKGKVYDVESEKPLLDDDGNEITSEVSFQPEEKDGSVDVTFTFKALSLAGRQTVVFEDLYETESKRHIATHSEIDDEGQQVYIDYTKLEISKQDATTTSEVEGAKLSLYDEAGKLVDSWISSSEKHIVNELLPGKYRLVEEKAPNGYLISEEVEFVLEDKGELQKVVMYDEEITGKLHVIKVDGYSKKRLSGVTFMLFKKSGSVISSGIDKCLVDAWDKMDVETQEMIQAHKKAADDLYVGTYVTDDNGEFTTDKLLYGEYYLIETEAKDGYFLVLDACEFAIDTPDQMVDKTIENTGKEGRIDINPNPSAPRKGNGHYPKTGDTAPIKFILGLMLAAVTAFFVINRKRKSLVKESNNKKKGKKLLSIVAAGAIGISLATTTAYAAEPEDTTERIYDNEKHPVGYNGDAIVETKTAVYDTEDESTYDFDFEEVIEIDGVKYKLDGVTYEKKERKELPADIKSTVDKTFKDVAEDFKPKQTIRNSGVDYILDSFEVKPSEESELHLFYYDETDYQTVEPEHKVQVDYTYHDEATGKDYEVVLPYSKTQVVDSNYAIPVTFSGTVYGYDAAYITIGDRKIENPGESLTISNDIICMLIEKAGGNSADYTDFTVSYKGDAYTNEEGVLCRDYEIAAKAYGTKYRVYYEDDFKNLTTRYTCAAVYKITDKALQEFQKTSYDVTATASYVKEKAEKKAFTDTLVGKAVLSGAVVLGMAVIAALGIYMMKGGRKDTDYRSKRDSKKDYKKLNK